MLCSFARSPLLQGFLHKEELCKVSLTCFDMSLRVGCDLSVAGGMFL